MNAILIGDFMYDLLFEIDFVHSVLLRSKWTLCTIAMDQFIQNAICHWRKVFRVKLPFLAAKRGPGRPSNSEKESQERVSIFFI